MWSTGSCRKGKDEVRHRIRCTVPPSDRITCVSLSRLHSPLFGIVEQPALLIPQSPSSSYEVIFAATPPENHPCFISSTCLPELPHGSAERFSGDELSFPFWAEGGYWNNSAVISFVVSKCLSFFFFWRTIRSSQDADNQ